MIFPVKRLADLGFEIVATAGHRARCCAATASPCEVVPQALRGQGTGGETPSCELILAGEVDLVINTPHGQSGGPRLDGYEIRTAAVAADIPCITTVPGAAAAVQGIEALLRGDIGGRARCRTARRARAPSGSRRDDGYERLVRPPVLFRLGGGDAEAAHTDAARLSGLSRPAALAALAAASAHRARAGPCSGCDFPNAVGLAAGHGQGRRRR